MEEVHRSASQPLLSDSRDDTEGSDQDDMWDSRKSGGAKHRETFSVSNSETSNLEFRKNWELSFVMAALICLFFSPLVFQRSVGAFIFGKGCAEGGGICGILASPDLESYWPNVVQLMFFTVYLDLGNTVKLAWQGLIGTAVVGLNVYIMALLFPVGGKCNNMHGTERLFGAAYGLRTVCKEFEDENYAKFQWFVWLDVLLVIVLILGAKIEANTRKFALSWHASFMMAFMSPKGSSTSFAVAFTTIFAVVLAIVSMLHPAFRLSASIKVRQRDLSKDFCSVLNATNQFIRHSLSLPAVKRRAIVYDMEYRIKQFIASYRGMGTVYEFSWYENVIMCNRYGADRGSLWMLKECIGDFHGIESFVDKALMVMLKAILAETDEEKHEQVREQDKKELESHRELFTEKVDAMNRVVCECLHCLVDSCANTKASDADIANAYEQLKEKAQKIKIERENLEKAIMSAEYHLFSIGGIANKMRRPSPVRCHLRNNLLIYVYACLVISYEASKWPERWNTAKHELMEKQLLCSWGLSGLLHAVKTKVWFAILQLWGDMYSEKVSRCHIQISEERYWCPFWTKMWHDETTRSFIWTNTLAIYLAFIFGNVFDGGIWRPYQPGMAATLGVLISNYSGSAIRRNFMRLLGIILGKVTPIMLMAFIVNFNSDDDADASEGGLEACVHTIVLFLYMAFFANVYYTSPRWSLVGCLTAGFGCYSFADDKWDDSLFADRYREIGQVTFAILLQMCIDVADIAIHKSWSRDQVVENLRRIGCESNALDDMETGGRDTERALLIQAFHDCFCVPPKQETFEKIAQHSSKLQSIIERQRALADECGEDTVFVAGWRGPFKLQLLEETLPMIEQLKVELDICYLLKYHEVKSEVAVAGEDPVCFRTPGLQKLERIILDTLPITFMRLRELFDQKGTKPVLEHHMQAFYWTESGVENCSKIMEVNKLFKPEPGCLVSQEELYLLKNKDKALPVNILLKKRYITREEADFNDQSDQLRTASLPICVARRSLKDIWRLTCNINHTCFSSGYLRTTFGSEEWL